MRLELRVINIKGVQFGEKTEIKESTLCIDRQELQRLLQEDKRLGSVDIEVTHPGESCRLLQVADVIEPRAKIGGFLEDFPGALGKQGIVGVGSTCILRNVAVVTNDQSHVGSKRPYMPGKIIDMSGPVAEYGIYSDKQIVVVLPQPAEGVPRNDYRIALKVVGLKTAVYLARTGKGLVPDKTEVYDLPLPQKVDSGMEDLPKIAYIFQMYMNQLEEIKGEPILYGDNIRKFLPTIIHPNEIFDGAIVNAYQGGVNETYVLQNHPLIKELYRRHGKDICFVGVVLTISHGTEPERERSVAMAAKLTKFILGADGAILTKSGGGAPEIDMAQTADKCEEIGVKTALLMWQMTSTEAGGTLFNLPKVNAITATANLVKPIKFPAVDRVIGTPGTLPSGESVSSGFMRSKWDIVGVSDQLGYSSLRSVEY